MFVFCIVLVSVSFGYYVVGLLANCIVKSLHLFWFSETTKLFTVPRDVILPVACLVQRCSD